MHEIYSETEGVVSTPRWITALSCLHFGDLLASGSWSGEIRLWKIAIESSNKARSLSLTIIGTLPAPGIVNSLQLLLIPSAKADAWEWLARKKDARKGNSGQVNGTAASTRKQNKESVVIIAGLGREPRLGRWMTMKGDGAANGSRVFVLQQE